MKKLNKLFILTFISLIFLLTNCKKENETVKNINLIDKEKINIVVTSDLHFLSKTMVHKDSSLLKENYYGDGRIICYNEELIDAFIYQMQIEKPDVIIITGDLTFDGSYQNHLELTKKLNILKENNIKILIVPGNHDINNINSKRYLSKGVESVKALSNFDYKEVYFNFGLDEAIETDNESYSYFCKISQQLGILMLDTNIYDSHGNPSYTMTSGNIKNETIFWIDSVLSKYQGLDIIVAGHHNLFKHSTLFQSGYQLDNYKILEGILLRNGVKLYLSGHMHIQHIELNSNVTEILTSALSITPHQYGVIEYSAKNSLMYNYYTKTTKVSEYAKYINSNDPKLLDFEEYSKQFYEKSSFEKAYLNIMMNNSSLHNEATSLGNLMKLLNIPYFAGTAYNIVKDIKNTEDYKTINKYELSKYIDSIIEGSKEDYRYKKIYR